MGDFSLNLEYVFHAGGHQNKDVFAQKIGINRTVLSRIMSGERAYNNRHLHIIAKFLGCDTVDLIINHEDFRLFYDKKLNRSNLRMLAFRTIQRHQPAWDEFCLKFSGQYIVYYSRTPQNEVVCSLLTIKGSNKDGIEFELINPYKGADGEYSAFEYDGYVYPMGDSAYLIAEQRSNTYEVLTIIFHIPKSPKPSVLYGLLSGVGVKKEGSSVAAVAIVLCPVRSKIYDWRGELGERLGFVPFVKLPKLVQEKSEKKVIQVHSDGRLE